MHWDIITVTTVCPWSLWKMWWNNLISRINWWSMNAPPSSYPVLNLSLLFSLHHSNFLLIVFRKPLLCIRNDDNKADLKTSSYKFLWTTLWSEVATLALGKNGFVGLIFPWTKAWMPRASSCSNYWRNDGFHCLSHLLHMPLGHSTSKYLESL